MMTMNITMGKNVTMGENITKGMNCSNEEQDLALILKIDLLIKYVLTTIGIFGNILIYVSKKKYKL